MKEWRESRIVIHSYFFPFCMQTNIVTSATAPFNCFWLCSRRTEPSRKVVICCSNRFCAEFLHRSPPFSRTPQLHPLSPPHSFSAPKQANRRRSPSVFMTLDSKITEEKTGGKNAIVWLPEIITSLYESGARTEHLLKNTFKSLMFTGGVASCCNSQRLAAGWSFGGEDFLQERSSFRSRWHVWRSFKTPQSLHHLPGGA